MISSSDDASPVEGRQAESPVTEAMDLFEDPSAHDHVREATPPIATTTNPSFTAVKVPTYAQKQVDHPPPSGLVSALKRIALLQPAKPPFLRRNLKAGLLDAFVRHYSERDLPIPKISAAPKKHSINVRWMYTLREEDSKSGLRSISWPAMQDSWRCQLCNTFHPFKQGKLLLFHLRKDHSEVVTRLRKLGPGYWLLQVEVSNDAITHK
jgi:hypothetical protein